MMSFNVQFPAWLQRGPWPYEAGIFLLLLWLAECVRNNATQAARYVAQPILYWAVVENSAATVVVLSTAAMAILIGLGLVSANRCRQAKWWRVAGLAASSLIFAFLAYGFHATWDYSFGGGAYLLLTWRTFCVAFRLGQEIKENA
jgi:hypothetical protein